MLIDVFKMPPAIGIPINRRQTICKQIPLSTALLEPVTNWSTLPLPRNALIVGSLIDRMPKSLAKAIYISPDRAWIFEVVFSFESMMYVCLYVKVINTFDAGLAVSLNAIKFFHKQMRELVPVWRFIDHSGSTNLPFMSDTYLDVENIVPVIVSLDKLSEILDQEIDLGRTETGREERRKMYKPLYDHIPGVFTAMMTGDFIKPPIFELPHYEPNYEMHHDRFSYYDEFIHNAQVRELEHYVNHQAFDSIVLSVMNLTTVKFSIMTTFAFAIDELEGLWITHSYLNPYDRMLLGSMPLSFYSDRQKDLQRKMSGILRTIALTYCRLNNYDFNDFMKTCQEKSSITLSKNEYDEVMILIHDVVHGRYVSFYTSFPAIALATIAVGSHHG